MDVVDPWREDEGWTVTTETVCCTPDTVLGSEHLRDVYVAADPTYTGRVTVPVLWDRERQTIVNNESIDITSPACVQPFLAYLADFILCNTVELPRRSLFTVM